MNAGGALGAQPHAAYPFRGPWIANIFPGALVTRALFTAFAEAMPDVEAARQPELGKTPIFTARELEGMGYQIVLSPVASPRVADKAQGYLYAAIARDGGAHILVLRMQTRAELCDMIGLHDYEALDASIVKILFPKADTRRRTP